MNRIKTLIHLHTDYSFDSDISLELLAEFLEREGFGCVAVTDHDSIEGALRLRAMTRAKVIVGEEVSTRDGHLIGLFLEQRVRPGLSAKETALAIREQGGLVLLPHPFVQLFGCALGKESWQIAESIDAVEILNAQNFWSRPDRRAERFAREFGLPMFVGSDSHLRSSIAPCYQMMDDFSDPQSFLESLRGAELYRARHPLSYFATSAIRTARYYMGLPLGAECGVHAVTHSSRAGKLAPA